MISPPLAVYRLAAAALAPVAAWRLRRAAAAESGLLARQRERHGDVPQGHGELWLHAASVGEVNAAAALVGALLARDESLKLVVSNVTHTGALEVARRFGDQPRVRHLFAPLDTPGRVRRWLDRTRPVGLVLVEAELWPELLHQCRARALPLALVNARIRPATVARDRRCGRLLAGLLKDAAVICCQSDADRQRFRALGVAPSRLRVTGNLKHDAAAEAEPPPEIDDWMSRLAGRRIWLAGSTHPGEEELLARAQRRVREQLRDALLVLAPRHPERAGRVVNTLRRAGIEAAAIDSNYNPDRVDALVVDRLGVLAALYKSSQINLVGGSLVEGVGGHNLVEAAITGRPVLAGPWTQGQHPMVDGLKQAAALIEVVDSDAVAARVVELLNDRQLRAEFGARARAWAQAQRGALDPTLEALAPLLDATDSNARR